MARKGIPFLDFDDLITAIQALSAPSATNVSFSPTGAEIITEDNVQGALMELDGAVDSVNASLTQKLSKEWTQLTGTISENQNIPIGSDYTEIHIDGAMSNGTVLQFDIQIIPNYGTIRRDEGYYYNASTCGGGAVSFNTSTRNLVIYSPYMGGSASSYSAIKVFVR